MNIRNPSIRPEGRELDFFRRNESLLFGVVIVIAILPFLGLGWHDFEGDEGMWALRAKAIVEHGVWMDQTDYSVNGLYSSAYPPLHIWAMAASMKLFGTSIAAARLPSAFFGFATVIVIFYIARKVYGFRSAVIASIVFGLSRDFLDHSRTAEMDVTYVFWVTLSLYMYMRYQRGSGRPIVILPLAGVATGMALMTKPLIGLYVPMVLLPYLIYMAVFQRYGWRRVVSDLLVLGLGAIAVSSWWHVFMMGKHPGSEAERSFWGWLFERNVLERAAGPMEGHSSGWGPLYYVNALISYYPFAFCLGIVGLVEACRSLQHKILYRPPSFPSEAGGIVDRAPLSVDDRMRLLILCWLVVSFLVPTLFGSKVSKYVMMSTVPFSILSGVAIDRVYRGATSRETNVSIFVWTVTAVVYWQTHKAHHALEAILDSLWTLRALDAGEMALLYDGGAMALFRVAAAGMGALLLAVGAWSLRNRLVFDHETVGRWVVPVIIGPMLIIGIVRVVIPPAGDAGTPGPHPLAAEIAFRNAHAVAEKNGLGRIDLPDHVIVIGHWRDNFQMAYYTCGASSGVDWIVRTPHSCVPPDGEGQVPRFVRLEFDDVDGAWDRYDQGLEKTPTPFEDLLSEVDKNLLAGIRDAGETALVVCVLYDPSLASGESKVQTVLSFIQSSYKLVPLHHDTVGKGFALYHLR